MRDIVFPTYPSNFPKDIPMQTILGPSRSHVVSSLLGSYLGLPGPFGGPLWSGGPPSKVSWIFQHIFLPLPLEGPPNGIFFLKSSVWGSPGEDPQMELLFLKSSVWGSPGEDPPKEFMKFSAYFHATPPGGTPKWNFFCWKVPFGGPLGRTPKWNFFFFWKVPFGRPLGRTPQTNAWFSPHIFLPLILPLWGLI